LNDGLKEANVNLADYDYLLRLDGQTILPTNFVEYALAQNCDLFGESVHAALIKVSTFLKLMNGKFHPETDEIYMTHKFAVQAKTCPSYGSLKIQHSTNETNHSANDHRGTGILLYKIGYEPFHILLILLRNHTWIHLLWFQGYLIAMLQRRSKFDFASQLWQYQMGRLVSKIGYIHINFL